MGSLESLRWFVPELVLSATLLVVIAVDLIRGRDAGEWPGTVAFVGAALALVTTLLLPGVLGSGGLLGGVPQQWLFGRMLVMDAFSVFFKLLLGLSLLAAVWMSLRSPEVRGRPNEGEYHTLLLGSGLGMFLMASAANLLMAYLALEFVSLTSYVLTGHLKNNRRSGEAALKYLIFGGVASGAMIYGMSWLFGLTGAMDYAGIAAGLGKLDAGSRGALFVALLLVLSGFGYKISAVPFHMWAPDVYTGAPLPVTTFLAVGSKAAGFAMLLRFFAFGVTPEGPSAVVTSIPLPQLLAVISVATMTLGNLAALQQTNMKRLLAYSSIAHAGYALLGLVVFRQDGLDAVLLYLATYYLMNLGAFVVVMLVAIQTGREDLEGYRGLAWRGGALPAVALSIFLFSLAGLPPLAGFLGKFYVFAAGIQGHLYVPVVIAVLNSVVSLYYYARVVKVMILDQPAPDAPRVAFRPVDLGVVSALSLATTFLVVQFGWLLRTVAEAGRVFRGVTAPGVLYVVATPIGNLEDVSLRALRVLAEVDLIAAEDTRRTSILLRHHGISTRQVSYYDAIERRRTPELVERMRDGARVALVTDAGTPGIADPGYHLVRGAIEAGIPVVPVPGASAVTALVSVAGLPVDRFAFEGFLPARAAARAARLRGLATEPRAMVFLEAGRRLGAFLKDAEAALGDREAVIGRELTKVHEEQVRGRLSELRARVEAGEPVRGEVTIVVAGAPAPEALAPDTLDAAIREALASGRSVRELSAALAEELGLPRREVYRRALALRGTRLGQ